MPATPAPPVLPPSWQQVLEKIEDSLAAMLRETDADAEAPPAATDGSAWRDALARLDDRLAALDDCAGRAGRAAAEGDAALAGAAEGLDGWLRATQAARRNLADGADGAV
jgi:hypothetical protein